MNLLFTLLIALTVGSAALLHFDRMSALALTMVEIESWLGLPLPASLGGLAIVIRLLSRPKRNPPPPSQVVQGPQPTETSVPAQETFNPELDWIDQVKESAKQLELPPGARMTFHLGRPCPIVLSLDQAPSERCRRAIGILGAWLATIPSPPRVRIAFDHCPEGGSPRHHQVAGALSLHLNRSDFKTMRDIDAVDVMFHHADPRWLKSPH